MVADQFHLYHLVVHDVGPISPFRLVPLYRITYVQMNVGDGGIGVIIIQEPSTPSIFNMLGTLRCFLYS